MAEGPVRHTRKAPCAAEKLQHAVCSIRTFHLQASTHGANASLVETGSSSAPCRTFKDLPAAIHSCCQRFHHFIVDVGGHRGLPCPDVCGAQVVLPSLPANVSHLCRVLPRVSPAADSLSVRNYDQLAGHGRGPMPQSGLPKQSHGWLSSHMTNLWSRRPLQQLLGEGPAPSRSSAFVQSFRSRQPDRSLGIRGGSGYTSLRRYRRQIVRRQNDVPENA